MSSGQFELLGHDNPLGRYPAPVVPVGLLDDSLVVIYAGKENNQEVVALREKVLFVPHEDTTKSFLANFNYLQDRLFAFDEQTITYYPIQTEASFLAEVLNYSIIRREDPFFRLTLAKGSRRPDLIRNEMVSCLREFDAATPHGEAFISAWYAAQRATLSEFTVIGNELVFPIHWQDFLDEQVSRDQIKKQPRHAATSVSWIASYHSDYEFGYEGYLYRAGAGAAMARKPMNQTAVIAHFAEKFGVSRRQMRELFRELAAFATREIRSTQEFVLPGFGRLILSRRKGRIGRNPATGERIDIAAKVTLKFRLAKQMKDAIFSENLRCLRNRSQDYIREPVKDQP